MDLKAAVAVAKQQVSALLAPAVPDNVRLEEFLYDDHLGVWSLTIGYALRDRQAAPAAREFKIVRISEAGKSVLSVRDR